MHWVVILAGLAACYRTGSEAPCTVQCGASNSCPDDLVCDVSMGRCALANGSCRVVDASTHDVDELIDSPIDSIGRDSPDSPDGPTSGMCNPGSPISVTVLTQGRWFIADRPAQRAVKYDSSLGVLVTDTPDTQNALDYRDAFENIPAGFSYDAPRLAVAGNEMFVTQAQSSTYTIARSTRDFAANTWSLPVSLDMREQDASTQIAVGPTSAVGAPTNSAPRFMLFTSAIPAISPDELVEISPMEWRRVLTHPASYGSVLYLGHGTLSENGLRMVFTGQDGGGIVSGYYVDRPSFGVAFGPPATKIMTSETLSVVTPYLTADCKHFYYSDPNSGNGGTIRHVTYP